MGDFGYYQIAPCVNCKKYRGHFTKRKRGAGIEICRGCNLPYFRIATPQQRQKFGRKVA